MSVTASTTRLRRSLPPLGLPLFVLGAAIVLAVGFFGPNYWSSSLVSDTVGWALACAVAATFLRFAFQERAATALVAVAGLYFGLGVGLAETATVALFLVSTRQLGVGALTLVGAEAGPEFEFSRPFAVGLALYFALFGALVYAPLNSQGLYCVILVAPLVFAVALSRGRENLGSWRTALADAEAAVARLPYWRFAATVALIGFVARFAFFPTIGSDDNAAHLRLWTELTSLGRDAFAIDDNVWAVSPFGLDLIHAIVSLAAGSDARAALDLALFALSLRQIWSLFKALRVEESDGLIVLALFASTPLLADLLTALHAEIFLCLLGLLGARFLVNRARAFDIGDCVAVGAVAALCMATKLPAAVLGGALFAVALAKAFTQQGREEWPRALRNWPFVLAIFAIFAFVALHSYALAYALTHNPVFPLLNGLFCSSHFPCQNLSDPRWAHGFGLRSYLGLFFHTHLFQESSDYTAGFQYLFLLPFGVFVICRRLKPLDAAAVLAPLLLFGVAMFSQSTYLRYLFPAEGLATVAIAMLLTRRKLTRILARSAMGACIAINLFFLPGSSWIFATAPQSVYSAQDRAQAIPQLSASTELTHELNRLGGSPRVLYPPAAPSGATLLGEPLYANWYASARAKKFNRLKTEADVVAFLRDERVDYALIWPLAAAQPADQLVDSYLTRFGEPIFDAGPFTVVRVRDVPLHYRTVFDLGAQAPAQADETPRVIAHLETGGAAFGRYSARFACANATGSFVAQINWDAGPAYYRLTRCAEGERSVADVFRIPPGARRGDVFVTTRDAGGAKVQALTVETD